MLTGSKFIDYIKNGGDKPFVSLQIGAGAGFDCKLAGKEWVTEGTIEDTIRAYEMVGCEPMINVGIPDMGAIVDSLRWRQEYSVQGNSRFTKRILATPFGEISWELQEQKKHGITPIKYPLTIDSPVIFDIVRWYSEQHLKGLKDIGSLLKPVIDQVHKSAPVSVQWNVQPFELMGLLSVQDLAMLALLNKEEYRKTCDCIRYVNIELCREVYKAGADFVFLGGPGAEMISPSIYEDFIIPDSKIITDAVHAMGGLIYSHICSPIEPFLTMGFYNRMGLDLFETLSPPPVGSVACLKTARGIIDENICTRGNVGLDVLLNGSAEEIEKATLDVLDATRGTKHMVAASDYLFYDIPLENVKVLMDTVNQYK